MRLADDDVCDFCFSGDCDSDDPIIYCDSCSCCVHASCYQIKGELPDEFLCDSCLNPEKTCCLCYNNLKYCMQQINHSNLLAHALCFRFAPTLTFEFFEPLNCGIDQTSVENNIKTNISNYNCDICGLPGNVKDCCVERCKCCFHPSCCLQSGGKLIIKESSTHEYLQLVCELHNKHQSFEVNLWNGVEKILRQDFDFPVDFDSTNIGKIVQSVFTIESEQTFQESLKIYGILARKSYDRLLNFEQGAMLGVQKIWQLVKRNRPHEPLQVGSIFKEFDCGEPKMISFSVEGQQFQLVMIQQLLSDGLNFEAKSIDFEFKQVLSFEDLEILYVKGVFLIGILENVQFESFFGVLLEKEQQNLHCKCQYCVFDLGWYEGSLAGNLGLFGVQLESYQDEKILSYQ